MAWLPSPRLSPKVLQVLIRAALWVWDFVVGDAWIVLGVVLAGAIGGLIHTSSSVTLERLEGPLMFTVVILGMVLSLWQGARQGR
jgi:ABC-type phosphate/phosphonate transport system permease subunit